MASNRKWAQTNGRSDNFQICLILYEAVYTYLYIRIYGYLFDNILGKCFSTFFPNLSSLPLWTKYLLWNYNRSTFRDSP